MLIKVGCLTCLGLYAGAVCKEEGEKHCNLPLVTIPMQASLKINQL